MFMYFIFKYSRKQERQPRKKVKQKKSYAQQNQKSKCTDKKAEDFKKPKCAFKKKQEQYMTKDNQKCMEEFNTNSI